VPEIFGHLQNLIESFRISSLDPLYCGEYEPQSEFGGRPDSGESYGPVAFLAMGAVNVAQDLQVHDPSGKAH